MFRCQAIAIYLASTVLIWNAANAQEASKDAAVRPAEETKVYFFKLKNGNSMLVEGILNRLFESPSGQGRIAGRAPSRAATPAHGRGPTITFPQKLSEAGAKLNGRVIFVADPARESILVTTAPENWLVVKEFLEIVDQANQQERPASAPSTQPVSDR